MPWNVADVDKHKKGLSDKQKKQWVRIANTALASCMKKGGTEEECAASAIRQANGVLNANSGEYAIYKNKPDSDYEVKLTTHQEKPYYVVPVVMMVEGVHNGSHGPLLHKIEELGKIPASWNGIPVVIDHPEDTDGTPISANEPEVIDNHSVGKVYNTKVDGTRLVAEVWLDEEKLNSIAPEILKDITNNKLIEVSVGVFSEEEEEEGEWNGEKYISIAHNYRPDHLAILTEYVGACSCKDGCGIRVNKQNTAKWLGEVRSRGYAVLPIGNNADAGYREKMDAVYAALRTMDTDKSYSYLEEMYETYLIYSKSSESGTKMYRQDYSYESGKIELTGSPVEVHRKVEYVINSININKKEVNMANECAACKVKIDSLIANSKGRWTETDREFLQTLTEAQLDKMVPIEVEKVVEKIVEKEVQVNALTSDEKAALAFGQKQLAEMRQKMISEIQTNTVKGTWPDDVLKKMDDDTLERISKSVHKEEVVDYSLNGGGAPIVNAGAEEAMYPVGVEIETK
jgi:hypothetical protein